jgi:hypothetical protein
MAPFEIRNIYHSTSDMQQLPRAHCKDLANQWITDRKEGPPTHSLCAFVRQSTRVYVVLTLNSCKPGPTEQSGRVRSAQVALMLTSLRKYVVKETESMRE